ncbi:MAG: hypothetical protein AB1567_12200 [bacterium]
MQLTEKEKDLLKKNAAITIIRNTPGFYNIHGYLLDISDDWILVQNISEFHLDGYSIIRKSDVDKMRYDNRDRYFEKILRIEGVRENVSKKYEINITDLPSIFKSLKITKLNIIVECEEPKNELFVIGKITQINKNSVSMLHFDACGRWEKQSTVIYYPEITIIRFDEEYINVFSRYLKLVSKD